MTFDIGLCATIIICVHVAALVSKTEKIWLKPVSLAIVPLASSIALYWGIGFIETGENPSSEYLNWAGVVVIPWSLSGYLAFGVSFLAFSWVRAKRAKDC